MSTNYPIALDDATTLGGPFIDEAPPVDPFLNIAAEPRNNINETILAIESRLGILGSDVTTSVDWGTLTVSSVPNQGLRFAGTHTDWPGVISESGIFVSDVTGNVSYHKSGDALNVFADLTGGGGVSSWDALYAANKTLTIDTSALVWTQTSTTGYGFQILRPSTVSADSPIVQIHNLNNSDVNACLGLDVASSSAYFIKANRDSGSAGDEFAVDGAGNVILAGALQRTVDGNLTISTVNGNIVLDSDTTSGDGIICNIDSSGVFRINAQAAHLGTFEANVSAWQMYASAVGRLDSDGSITYDANAGHYFTGQAAWFGTSGTPLTNDFMAYSNKNVEIEGQNSSYDVKLTSARDVIFNARASNNIPLNSATDVNLTTTKTNLVGAINDLAYGAITLSTVQTPVSLMLGVRPESNSLVIAEYGDLSTDFAHPVQTNPTLFIQSADATEPGQFISCSYNEILGGTMTTDTRPPIITIKGANAFAGATVEPNGGDIVIEGGDSTGTGTDGSIQLGSDVRIFGDTTIDDRILHDPPNATRTYSAYKLTLASTALFGTDVYMRGLEIDLTGAALDSGNAYGIDLGYTTGGGSGRSVALNIQKGWKTGISLDSDPPTAGLSAAICNEGSNASWLLYLGEGTVAGILSTTIARLTVAVSGAVAVNTDYSLAGPALTITQNDDDQAFTDFVGSAGTSGAYDSSKNIQTWIGGTGAVDGPRSPDSAAEAGYTFEGMVKEEVNGVEMWKPYYSYTPAQG